MSSTTVEPADPALGAQQVILAGQIPQERADLPAIYACFVYQFNADLLSAVYVFRDAKDQAVHDCTAIAAAAASNLRQSG